MPSPFRAVADYVRHEQDEDAATYRAAMELRLQEAAAVMAPGLVQTTVSTWLQEIDA